VKSWYITLGVALMLACEAESPEEAQRTFNSSQRLTPNGVDANGAPVCQYGIAPCPPVIAAELERQRTNGADAAIALMPILISIVERSLVTLPGDFLPHRAGFFPGGKPSGN